MSETETFQVGVDEGRVSVQLRRSDRSVPDRDRPSALICHGPPPLPYAHRPIADAVLDALVEAGLAVATFTPRLASAGLDAIGDHRADEIVDDAAAVFRWMALRDEIDMDRIGVVGAGAGAIVAATLAGRTDRIAGLCLVGPASADDLLDEAASADDAVASNGHVLPERFVESLRDLHAIDEAAAFERPTLIVQGAVPGEGAPTGPIKYLDRIENTGHRVEHVFIARADHLFSGAQGRVACLDRVSQFFKHLPALEPLTTPS